MLIYLTAFFIAILFTYFAERAHNKFVFLIFSAIPILSLSLLAGFRDSGVGTDTIVYVDYIWYTINSFHSFGELYRAYLNGDFAGIETVYLLINWGASWFGKDLFNIYFITNFCVVFPIYVAAYLHREKVPMWFVMLSFCFVFYGMSLNLVRQSISAALTVWSLKYLEEKKWMIYTIFIVLIINTHNTGIFYLTFPLIYFVWFHLRNLYLRKILIILFLFLFPICVFSMDFMITSAVNYSLLPDKYLMYLSSESESIITKSVLLVHLSILIIMLYIKIKNRYSLLSLSEINFINYLKILVIILFMSSYFSKWAYRISFYFSYSVECIMFPMLIYSIKRKNPIPYYLILLFTIVIYIVMWYWTIVHNGGYEIYPYKSKILDI